MGLYDRDYMWEKREKNTKRPSGGKNDWTPPDPNWKNTALTLSLVVNAILLFVLFKVCGI
jgi:hypothetical protein